MSYPALLDLRRLRVLIVGGGAVALRKAEGVLEAGGRPALIAPDVCAELGALVEREGLRWEARPYRAGDARSYHLVFAATDRREVNRQVAEESAESVALVNVADDPETSSFQVPATLRQGEVIVALATGGASPLLARRLRERLATVVTPGVGRAAARLRELRAELRARWPDDERRRRSLWFELVTPEFLDCAVAGQDEEVELRIARCLSQS
ncbi:MAG: bifunctional precorrin-2 dehydrogenase/sirohydrochlorin ferrochelatase [Gemmatimonadetes bacterium]|nr:bifunctional precorrin-2 dehydrogenase/sirohydrochlorin ferrochelatase [Gemmatimonadota bacterium]